VEQQVWQQQVEQASGSGVAGVQALLGVY